ncbi:MAG: winged helix-turn-helix domain-containing protein [Candidatus Endonucleobacter sp. (ex Gigantidas childressi)]|nr:winged helix-turn-helix domain-containing protein [Candidatus Endonucleobacter sp. (ex Gigantidas childressi)]
MNDEQTRQLIEHISDHIYAHIHQILAYLSEGWDVKYTVSGPNKWLHQQDFTYKKPKDTPHKFGSEKQDEFVEH